MTAVTVVTRSAVKGNRPHQIRGQKWEKKAGVEPAGDYDVPQEVANNIILS